MWQPHYFYCCMRSSILFFMLYVATPLFLLLYAVFHIISHVVCGNPINFYCCMRSSILFLMLYMATPLFLLLYAVFHIIFHVVCGNPIISIVVCGLPYYFSCCMWQPHYFYCCMRFSILFLMLYVATPLFLLLYAVFHIISHVVYGNPIISIVVCGLLRLGSSALVRQLAAEKENSENLLNFA